MCLWAVHACGQQKLALAPQAVELNVETQQSVDTCHCSVPAGDITGDDSPLRAATHVTSRHPSRHSQVAFTSLPQSYPHRGRPQTASRHH